MIRLSKQADYAIFLMSLVARRGPQTCSSSELAVEARLGEPIARKVLKMLSRADLLRSHRGVAGGYQLARDASSITVTDIIAAVDGPIAITECAEASSCACQQETVCITRPHWIRINHAIRSALAGITLAEMASEPGFSLSHPSPLPEAWVLLEEEEHQVPVGSPCPDHSDPLDRTADGAIKP